MTGWSAFTETEEFHSASSNWEDVPNELVLLLRYMQSGEETWAEQIFNVDVYVLTNQQEIDLVTDHKKFKRGLLIPFEALDELTRRAGKDDQII
jgi:hypothetical protein